MRSASNSYERGCSYFSCLPFCTAFEVGTVPISMGVPGCLPLCSMEYLVEEAFLFVWRQALCAVRRRRTGVGSCVVTQMACADVKRAHGHCTCADVKRAANFKYLFKLFYVGLLWYGVYRFGTISLQVPPVQCFLMLFAKNNGVLDSYEYP